MASNTEEPGTMCRAFAWGAAGSGPRTARAFIGPTPPHRDGHRRSCAGHQVPRLGGRGGWALGNGLSHGHAAHVTRLTMRRVDHARLAGSVVVQRDGGLCGGLAEAL